MIDTGDAFAYANIINVVNTNILNSNGFLFFLNSLFGNGTLDLNDYFSFFENGGEKDHHVHWNPAKGEERH